MVGDSLVWAAERIAELEARLAACEALVGRYREAEPRFNSGNPDMVSAHTLLLVILDELEAAIRGETNDEQAG